MITHESTKEDTTLTPSNADMEDIQWEVEESIFKKTLEGILLNFDGAYARAAVQAQEGSRKLEEKEGFCASPAKRRCQPMKHRRNESQTKVTHSLTLVSIVDLRRTSELQMKTCYVNLEEKWSINAEALFEVGSLNDNFPDIYDQFQIRDWEPFTMPLDPYFPELVRKFDASYRANYPLFRPMDRAVRAKGVITLATDVL
ncbi:hypothetical protein HAX54_044116, partial [Datura stramonium]|nr:hypothetical protein [Datura stramonium]